MTKEQLYAKWTINPDFKYDLEAVIAHEIAKVHEAKPEEPEQPAKPFDKDRFERMFRAVVVREPHWTYKDCMIETEKLFTQLESFYFLKQLDAYYASKEGGNAL